MQHRSIPLALAFALMLGSGAALAADDSKAATRPPAAGHPTASVKAKTSKPVDINRASAAQLKTVPGIGNAEADRIIKGRPYPTKTHLVTEKILSYEAYMAVKDRLVAIPTGLPKAKK